ncbi:MAG: trigger factor [Holosporales bacterium]|jgi:trigger factor|nr:trigger factor [Holosporales bacterium]
MRIKKQSTEGFCSHSEILIPAGEVAQREEERTDQVASRVRLPGFRPGKVPLSVIKRQYAEAIHAEVIEKLVSEAVQSLIQESKLRISRDPEVKILAETKEGVEVSVDCWTLPTVEAPKDFSDISVTRRVPQAQKEDIDQCLQDLLAQEKGWKEAPAKHKAQIGDHLVMEMTVRSSVKGAKEEKLKDFSLVLGDGHYLRPFWEHFLGVTVGETLSFSEEFSKKFENKRLAGKKAHCTARMTKISVLAPLDSPEALAQHKGYDSVKALQEALKQHLEEEGKRIAFLQLKKEVFDILSERNPFPISDDMEKAEFEAIWRNFEREQGEELTKLPKDKQEALRKEYRAIANRRVRLGILFAEIGKDLNVDVSSQELETCVSNFAAKDPQRAEAIYLYYRKNRQALASLRAEIFEGKVVEEILRRVHISEKTVPLRELRALGQEEPLSPKKAAPKKPKNLPPKEKKK